MLLVTEKRKLSYDSTGWFFNPTGQFDFSVRFFMLSARSYKSCKVVDVLHYYFVLLNLYSPLSSKAVEDLIALIGRHSRPVGNVVD